MDIDRYLVTNRPAWGQLADLTTRVGRKPSALGPDDIKRFIQLYEQASSQLSFARAHYDNPQLTAELTMLVGNANAVLYRRSSSPTASIRRFFTISFPAVVWHLRKTIGVAALVMIVPAAVFAIWLANDSRALDLAIPEAERAAYVDEEFEDYYNSEPASQFATRVLINNIRVSFLAFGAGIFLGLGTVFILAFNGVGIGMALAVFIAADQQSKFWGLILPHGLLELSAIVLAGAAGMSMGFAILAPGDRTRSSAFTEEARRAVLIVLGLILIFTIAGLIEGFVTPGLATIPRVMIGVMVESAFVAYIVGFGRRAAELGFTGLSTEHLEGATGRTALSA